MDQNLVYQNTVVLLPQRKSDIDKIKVEQKRWLIIFIFIYYTSINSLQWLQYASINNLVVKYYGVSSLTADWASTVYFIVYPILVIPAAYFIDKKGLRFTALFGCFGNLLSTLIKLFSLETNLFWVVLFGQTVAAISQLLIVCLPPKLAAVWFKDTEISTACSLGVFGSQFGFALGFIVPPSLVHDSDNLEDIKNGFKMLNWLLFGVMIPVTVAVVVYFPNQPVLPPSQTQLTLRKNKEEFNNKQFFKSIKFLLKNKAFILYTLAFSINFACTNAVSICLNQLVLQYFPGADDDVGIMGFLFIVLGMFGGILVGIFLDKTHKYKETSIFIYTSVLISLIGVMFSLKYQSKVATYITISVLGIFANAYTPAAFEFSMELTYPSEESTTTGIVMSGVQFLGIITTLTLGYCNQALDGFWAIGIQCLFLIIGNILVILVPNNLLRQEAFKRNNMSFRRKSSIIGISG